MTYVEDELNSQPECWIRAADEAAAHAVALPAPGERVAIVGCGTSFFMAQAAAVLRERSGQGETDAFAASEFPAGRSYDRVVALTRSGTTTEVLELLGRLRGHTRTTAVTADPRTPLATPLPEGLVGCAQFTFLGRGWTVGLANEAALKMREASLAWTESYPAMEYRHGPISVTTRGTATWMLGEAPEGLAEQVRG